MANIYDPKTMGKAVERTPIAKTFFKSLLFRNVETFMTASVDVDFKKGNRALAPFVHKRIGGKTVPNTGYETKTYTPPLVAPDTITTIDDILKRSAGENPYSGKSPAERAIEKMISDFKKLDEMITRREEWMCAQALFTGKIPIIGEGLNEEIDFGFTNFETLDTAGKKWSSDTSKPITDLKRWRKQVQETGFANCDICVMASDVAEAFVNNPSVQKLLDVKGYDLAVIKPKELPNGATYVGSIPGEGLDIYTVNEWYLDDWTNPDAPVQKPLVPDGKLALLSTGAEYSMYYAAVTLIDKKTDDFVTFEGERVPDSWTQRKPARRFLQLNSCPLPVPHEVDSWFIATVL